ncbi:topoisomerase DNA-binding C4 zinc finger domain-containing protein, partial [Vibrio cholerae]
VKQCSRCGSEMVLRETKRGENKGKQFWGCSGFPKCKTVEKFN